jgi:hypothetical protein
MELVLIENNRKVLSFLGTGVVVIISASWTVMGAPLFLTPFFMKKESYAHR